MPLSESGHSWLSFFTQKSWNWRLKISAWLCKEHYRSRAHVFTLILYILLIFLLFFYKMDIHSLNREWKSCKQESKPHAWTNRRSCDLWPQHNVIGERLHIHTCNLSLSLLWEIRGQKTTWVLWSTALLWITVRSWVLCWEHLAGDSPKPLQLCTSDLDINDNWLLSTNLRLPCLIEHDSWRPLLFPLLMLYESHKRVKDVAFFFFFLSFMYLLSVPLGICILHWISTSSSF